MGRKCEANFCFNNDGKNTGKSFYRFPRDTQSCQIWVEYCRSLELENEFNFGGSQALNKKRLCSDHFDLDALRDMGRTDKGLKIGAVPSVEFMWSDPSVSMCQTPEMDEMFYDIEYLEDIENITVDPNETISASMNVMAVDLPLGESVDNTAAEFTLVDITDYQNETFAPPTLEDSGYRTAEEFTPMDLSAKKLIDEHHRMSHSKESELRNTVNALKSKLRNSDRTSQRRLASKKKEARKRKDQNDELKRIRKVRAIDKRLLEDIANNPILHNSLQNSKRPAKARRYNQQMKQFAVSLYLCGPRVYRMIQRSNVLCLPTKRTIKRWTHQVRFKPGLNKEILRRTKTLSQNFSDLDRLVVLCIDGMKIKSSLTYSAKTDVFHGFPDNGLEKLTEKNKSTVLATEAVAVMIRGIYKPFKQGLGYFLTHNTLGSEEQLKLVESTIRAVRDIGLNPLVLTMDQYATNIKMAKEAGATTANPYIIVDGIPVYILWDPPHLTKNARNMLKKHNAVFNQNVASFDDIEQLYNIDSLSNPRLVPKLTEKHVRVPPFSPMNVSLATRTLSQSVASGIRYYVKTGELPERALQTASFIEMHDKLFDVFNSKRKACSAKPLKAALQQDSCHWKFLDEVQVILSKMYYTKKSCLEYSKATNESKDLTVVQRHPNYIRGFISNINALRQLWQDLRNDYKVDHLCTNPLDQDCLENEFAEARRRCGSNDAPDSLQFGTAFKYSAIEANLKTFNGENCEADGVRPLITSKDLGDFMTDSSGKNDHCILPASLKLPPLDTSKPLEITIRELNGLVYIIGAAVRKLPHKECVEHLVQERQDDEMDEAYDFIKIKQMFTSSILHLPNAKLFNIGVLCFAAFSQKFSHFLFQNKVGVKTKLKHYVDYDIFEDCICEKCFSILIDKIYNTLIQGFLKSVKAKQSADDKLKRGKRNRKARRMCLPL